MTNKGCSPLAWRFLVGDNKDDLELAGVVTPEEASLCPSVPVDDPLLVDGKLELLDVADLVVHLLSLFSRREMAAGFAGVCSASSLSSPSSSLVLVYCSHHDSISDSRNGFLASKCALKTSKQYVQCAFVAMFNRALARH